MDFNTREKLIDYIRNESLNLADSIDKIVPELAPHIGSLKICLDIEPDAIPGWTFSYTSPGYLYPPEVVNVSNKQEATAIGGNHDRETREEPKHERETTIND
jgi:hypothetical protein